VGRQEQLRANTGDYTGSNNPNDCHEKLAAIFVPGLKPTKSQNRTIPASQTLKSKISNWTRLL
jgi:hypothetical protein